MSYFSPAFASFLKDLDKNNNRDWFNDNKAIYLKEVKEPFERLVTEMMDRIKAIEPEIPMTPRKAIFRFHRDIRFSKDKTPYNKHVSAFICKGNKRGPNLPGFYFRLSAEGLTTGGGIFDLDKESLRKVREEIVFSLKEFSDLISRPEFEQKFETVQGAKNKIIPAEFKAEVALQPLIANKQFYYMTEMAPDFLLKDNLADILMDHFHASKPLNDFFDRALYGEE